MKLEEAAFTNLLVLARADGLVSPSEVSLLESYREALNVSVEFAEEALKNEGLRPLDESDIAGEPSDRLHILKMMIRVGYADGVISNRERKLLKWVAVSFGIGRVALRGLFWEIEQELGVKRKLRRSQIAAVAAIIAAAVIAWAAFEHFSGETERQLDQARIDFEELREKLGLERSHAEKALRLVRESQKGNVQSEAALAEQLELLLKKNAEEREALKAALTKDQESRLAAMQDEVERLRGELDRVRSRNVIFKEIEKEFGASIVLILTTYDLVMGGHRITRGAMGSGFFVSSCGHIVTNKHVVEPWKFKPDEVMLIANGYTVDQATKVTAAWPAGTEVKNKQGGLNLLSAYSSGAGTLAVYGTAPDTFEEQTRMLETGLPYKGKFHTLDNNDLAVIKAEPPYPVHPLPLANEADRLEKLDPVMVLGFPTGINILETTRAETSPSLGEVRKIETSIMVTAPIVPGNSGGPLIDLDGTVVGVASGSYGEATLGSCIPTSYVLPILPPADELLAEIARSAEAREYRAALDDLRLAGMLGAGDDEREKIRKERERILAIRDRMISEAEKLDDAGSRRKALEEIEKLFGR